MKKIRNVAWCATALVPWLEPVLAQQDAHTQWVTTSRPRWEFAIGVHSWPGIADVEPVRDGSFDEAGFSLSFAAHWPAWRFADSEILVGADLGLFTNDSSIPFVSEDIVARAGYIAPSMKWMFGHQHRYSLDAGLGYYLLDMAEVAGEYPAFFETQLWEDGAIGGYVGATLDLGGGRSGRNRGVMLSAKVHFVEFKEVRDEALVFPATLGQDAGDIAGPVYMLQVGYRWR